ncbi:sugar transporter ERD6-like 6 [Lathyrus oleraceus]|uniref:sugar transporter ERD6-like 6 n=1 Tax=Pisum sativum TaxID=3888 RepID=UPI0021CFB68C|nr:sugar transporter ERD6-like 6 [Pisum sativum]
MFRVLATILTLWLADKSGRRLLLIVSSSAMALSLLVVSISFYLKEYISPNSDLYATLSLVSVAGVVVMVIAFSLGLGAIPWIIMSEILPINIKGLAGSFATLANWFFSWLVTLTANLLLDWSSGEQPCPNGIQKLMKLDQVRALLEVLELGIVAKASQDVEDANGIKKLD